MRPEDGPGGKRPAEDATAGSPSLVLATLGRDHAVVRVCLQRLVAHTQEVEHVLLSGKKANRKPQPVAVPIYGDMRAYLENQPHLSDYLFTRGQAPIEDFRMSWDLACDAAGVPGLLFHDLRRTAVRNLRRAGVAESVIMKITGHRTRGIFERYNITHQSDTLEAGQMAEELLSQAHAQNSSQKKERSK